MTVIQYPQTDVLGDDKTLPLLLFEDSNLPGIGPMAFGNVYVLLYLVLICGALCYLRWNEAIAEIGAMRAILYVYAFRLSP